MYGESIAMGLIADKKYYKLVFVVVFTLLAVWGALFLWMASVRRQGHYYSWEIKEDMRVISKALDLYENEHGCLPKKLSDIEPYIDQNMYGSVTHKYGQKRPLFSEFQFDPAFNPLNQDRWLVTHTQGGGYWINTIWLRHSGEIGSTWALILF